MTTEDRVARAARLTVCRHATDAADARHLLDVLGLLGEPEPVRHLTRPDVRLRQRPARERMAGVIQ